MAEQLEISPYLIAELRRRHNLYTADEYEDIAGRLLSYILGLYFGRWSSDGISTDKEEILSICPYSNEFSDFVQESIESLFDEPATVLDQIRSNLGNSPSEWMRKQFFRNHHTDEYKRRGQRTPIYWQLESSNGAFSCFVYYHEIDENTLPKLRGQYLDPRIDELENELETLNAQTSGDNPDKELLKRKEKVQDDLDDIKEFRETIDEMVDDGVSVDVEKGIWENIKEWDQYEVLKTGLPKLKSSYSR
ncbi:hypothetical protein KM295_13055 [Natronomonas sp. F2-12]|uniref:Uncharacterized protein n=1 Tax=Natronomonas aquatica TaxID=2841590 RepID=A0A9R1CVK3_9EURY|nr:BREX-1 system adenine-specific DNA-methyltransferase PglX [Natronomonas aquatica]MCQ4334386.1 hypothetical protein [Natronomonas aquatica]